ncbi:MAG: TonB-dependent receptor [Chloroherpetonaceae bacterium]|nr:TonB-dependent receptor [Chloroherpetonaceae bacterium]MDW8437139.1 TonB-dependent receptor [Chloroherpetonaceae bacterium]
MKQACLIFSFLVVSVCAYGQTATLKGRITTSDGDVAVGVSVFIKDSKIGTVTKADGSYRLEKLPAGAQTIVVSGVGFKRVERTIGLSPNEETVADFVLEVEAIKAQDIVVYGASRRKQKLTEAPAAVTVITPTELERGSIHGQLGKVLEHQQGIDVVQSGANDFNINARGFNNSINRRVLVLIDGRDPSTPLLNLQEWNSLATTLSDVQQIEVVRGPGSALFGTNAYNGVINITTYAPRDVLGTRAAFTFGEWNTYRGEFRHAQAFGNFAFKINGGFARMRNVTLVSRDTATGGRLEYPGVGIDRRPLKDEWFDNFNNVLTLRGDYDFNADERLTLEGGISNSGNEVYVNNIGRILIPLVNKPFVRLAYNSPRLNFQTVWNRRFTPFPQPVLNTPAANSAEDSDDITTELQVNNLFFDNRLRAIAGVSHQWQRIETVVSGAQPLLSANSLTRNNLHNTFTGIYGQLEYNLFPNLQLVGATRVDFSTLIETKISPKAAIVYSPFENHTFRFTVNQAFLRPSYPDFYRRSQLGAPINLASTVRVINDSLRLLGVSDTLTFSRLDRFSLGNPNIRPEEALSFEVGYKGVISRSFFVTVDAYLNRRRNFISSPLSVNAPLVFAPYRYASATPDINQYVNRRLAEGIRAARLNPVELVIAENRPMLVQTVINVGLIEEIGLELGVNYYATDNLLLTANYAYLNAKVLENAVPTQPIFPNTSPHRFNVGASYNVPNKFDVSANLRYVDGFPWLAGVQQGFVPAYAVLNLNGSYYVTRNWRVGFNVFNALDRRHYQIFGGTILRRQATITTSLTL